MKFFSLYHLSGRFKVKKPIIDCEYVILHAIQPPLSSAIKIYSQFIVAHNRHTHKHQQLAASSFIIFWQTWPEWKFFFFFCLPPSFFFQIFLRNLKNFSLHIGLYVVSSTWPKNFHFHSELLCPKFFSMAASLMPIYPLGIWSESTSLFLIRKQLTFSICHFWLQKYYTTIPRPNYMFQIM